MFKKWNIAASLETPEKKTKEDLWDLQVQQNTSSPLQSHHLLIETLTLNHCETDQLW